MADEQNIQDTGMYGSDPETGEPYKSMNEAGRNWAKNTRLGYIWGIITNAVKQVRVFFNNLIFGQDEAPFPWQAQDEPGDSRWVSVSDAEEDLDMAAEEEPAPEPATEPEDRHNTQKKEKREAPGFSLSLDKRLGLAEKLSIHSPSPDIYFQVRGDNVILNDRRTGKGFVLEDAVKNLAAYDFNEFAGKLAAAFGNISPGQEEADARAAVSLAVLAAEELLPDSKDDIKASLSFLDGAKYVMLTAEGTPGADGRPSVSRTESGQEQVFRAGKNEIRFSSHVENDSVKVSVLLDGKDISEGKPFPARNDRDAEYIADRLEKAGFTGGQGISSRSAAYTVALLSNQALEPFQGKKNDYFCPADGHYRQGTQAFHMLEHTREGLLVSGMFPDREAGNGWKKDPAVLISPASDPQVAASCVGKLFHDMEGCRKQAQSACPEELHKRDAGAGRPEMMWGKYVHECPAAMDPDPVSGPEGTVFTDESLGPVAEEMTRAAGQPPMTETYCVPYREEGKDGYLRFCSLEKGIDIHAGQVWDSMKQGDYSTAARAYAAFLYETRTEGKNLSREEGSRLKTEMSVRSVLGIAMAQQAAAGQYTDVCASIPCMTDNGTARIGCMCDGKDMAFLVNGHIAAQIPFPSDSHDLETAIQPVIRACHEEILAQGSGELVCNLDPQHDMVIQSRGDGNVSLMVNGTDGIREDAGTYCLSDPEALDAMYDRLDMMGVESPGTASFLVYASQSESVMFPSDGSVWMDMDCSVESGVSVYLNMQGTENGKDWYASKEVAFFRNFSDLDYRDMHAIRDACLQAEQEPAADGSGPAMPDPDKGWTVTDTPPCHTGPTEVRETDFLMETHGLDAESRILAEAIREEPELFRGEDPGMEHVPDREPETPGEILPDEPDETLDI